MGLIQKSKGKAEAEFAKKKKAECIVRRVSNDYLSSVHEKKEKGPRQRRKVPSNNSKATKN